MATVRADTLPGATTSATTLALSRAGLWSLFVGHVIAGWGTQWDVQWHMTIGRDSFWIAPHVMTYSGVTVLVLVSFGVLAWTSVVGARDPRAVRFAGLEATPGWHLAAWGIALTVLAAPIDDLWHRLFGLDVTLWSPPHLLGLIGGITNAAACWLIAREAYPAGSRARLSALVFAGSIVYGSIGFGIQPGIRIAYAHGGVLFFTTPILAALFASMPLLTTARLSALRVAPVLAVLIMLVNGTLGTVVARAGFDWLQPVSYITEEIAKDPTSPIAISHEIARKNGTRPGVYLPIIIGGPLLGAIAMALVDARRRPRRATLAFGATVFVVTTILLWRLPAFAASLPSVSATVVAAILAILASFVTGHLARSLRT